MNEYCVYKHTSPNGKVYIGITNQTPERRWRADGSGYRQNEHFKNAIKKYGWDNFTHEILQTGLTKEEACSVEKKLIQKYKSFLIKFGYNQSLGGEHGNHGEETKQKLSKAVSELWENEEYRSHMSEAHKGKSRTGWKHTQSAKDKMSAFQKRQPQEIVDFRVGNLQKYRESEAGKAEMSRRSKELWNDEDFRQKNIQRLYGNHYRRKAVVCVETGEVFETVESAANHIGRTRDAVGRVCRGLNKKSGGFHWRFADERDQ